MCGYHEEDKPSYFYPTIGFAVLLLLALAPLYIMQISMNKDVSRLIRNVKKLERQEKEPFNVIRSSYDRMEERSVKPANDPTEEPKFWEK